MCGFEILRMFSRIFESYGFSATIFINILSYQNFHVKGLLLSWDVCVYRQAREC